MADIDLDADMQAEVVFAPLVVEHKTFVYFAWVNADETTFTDAHKRVDEDIFQFDLHQEEGDFCALSIQVRNPRIGLLAPSRKVWAWFAFNVSGVASPQFFGRLIGIPSNIQEEIITLEFIARPLNFYEQKVVLAESMKAPPYWDDIWISAESRFDPDTVLEARAQLWDVDRVTHAVSATDILIGEDSLLSFGDDVVHRDSVKVSLAGSPVRAVSVEANLTWSQVAGGQVDMSSYLKRNWPHENDDTPWLITSFSGEGLINSWPKAGSSIGGGWSVLDGKAEAKQSIAVSNEFDALEVGPGGILMPKDVSPGSVVIPTLRATVFASIFLESIVIPLWYIKPTLVVQYDIERARAEVVRFVLRTDVQDLITMPDDTDRIPLTFSSVDLSAPMMSVEGYQWQAPIGDLRARSFIPTVRGQQALQYLISVARATLIEHSRAIEVSFDVPLLEGLEVNCRRSATITPTYPPLPGGTVTGKIKSYSFTLDGEGGEAICSITLAVCVGRGNSIAEFVGDADYVEDTYTELGYFRRKNVIEAVGAGDVGFEPPADNPNDDGIDFTKAFKDKDIVTLFEVTGFPSEQRVIMGAVQAEENKLLDEGRISEALQTIPTRVHMEFLNLEGGPFQTDYEIAVTDLVLPQGIDLEAEAVT